MELSYEFLIISVVSIILVLLFLVLSSSPLNVLLIVGVVFGLVLCVFFSPFLAAGYGISWVIYSFLVFLASGGVIILIYKFVDFFRRPKQKIEPEKPHIQQSTATKRNSLIRVSKVAPIHLPSFKAPSFSFKKKPQNQPKQSPLLGTVPLQSPPYARKKPIKTK